jgi:hypothetical protein
MWCTRVPTIGVELPPIRIQPLYIDFDIALPIEDEFDAALRVIGDGVGNTGHNDFMIVVRLAAVDRMLRNEPWPQLGDFGDVQGAHDRPCEFMRGDPVASLVARRKGQLRHEFRGAGDERFEAALCFAVQHLFHELVQDGSPRRAANDRGGRLFDCLLDRFRAAENRLTFDRGGRRRLAPAGLAPLDLAVGSNDVAGFFGEKIPRLLVLRRRGRRLHRIAERLGIDRRERRQIKVDDVPKGALLESGRVCPIGAARLAASVPPRGRHNLASFQFAVWTAPAAHMHVAAPAPAMSRDTALEMGHGAGMDMQGMVRDMRNRFWICLVFSVPIFLYSPMGSRFISLKPPFGIELNLFLFFLASAAIIYPAWPFAVAAVRALRNRVLNMAVLVLLSVGTGYLFSVGATFLFKGEQFYEASAMLLVFILLGHWLEMRARAGASEAISALMDLAPPLATVLRSGREVEIPTAETPRRTP